MKAGQFLILILLNSGLIFLLYYVQKRLLENRIRHLTKQVDDLENLVAAIMEEFEAVIDEKVAANSDFEIKMGDPVAESQLADSGMNPTPVDSLEPTDNFYKVLNESEKVDFTNDSREQIYELWNNGLTVEAIAKQLRTGQGEVQLAIKMHKRS